VGILGRPELLSETGAPVDVVSALTALPAGLAADPEARREYALGAVTALLGLIQHRGAADALTDPAAILLCRLLEDAFARGEALPLDRLIPAVVDPALTQVGVFHVDTFLPREERLELAKRLNTVLASPGFTAWRRGAPLDIEAWLAPRDGKTPITVLYLAHLDEPGRRFFLTLLLHAVVGWSRRQPGTPDLRACLYLDEVAGWLPPHPANPPTKWPILTLLKQARAVGVGVVLATQNPVDLDYKAMSNAGTWLVGRLRTRQDRARVIDGLVQAGVEPGDVDDQLASLPARTFLVLDDRGATQVTSRHTRALLRGPLTRAEVARLVRDGGAAAALDDGLLAAPPPLPAGLAARWLHADGAASLGHTPTPEDAVWEPALYARFSLRFDLQDEVVERRTAHRLAWNAPADPFTGVPTPAAVDLPDAWLHHDRPPGGRYRPLPGWLATATHDLVRGWLRLARDEETGPDEAPGLEGDDVHLLGVAVVWIPTTPTTRSMP
jgi:hypothetical protein